MDQGKGDAMSDMDRMMAEMRNPVLIERADLDALRSERDVLRTRVAQLAVLAGEWETEAGPHQDPWARMFRDHAQQLRAFLGTEKQS